METYLDHNGQTEDFVQSTGKCYRMSQTVVDFVTTETINEDFRLLFFPSRLSAQQKNPSEAFISGIMARHTWSGE